MYNSLRPSDLVSVWTFSQSVNEILPMCRKRDIPSMRSVLATIQTGGGTAMRDAIAQQIEHRRTHPDSSRAFELVVLTDGEDNSSTISEQDLAELLRRPGSPHFHLILIGVGIAAEYRTRLEALCQPDHCTFMSVESSAEAISGAFHRTTEAIQHRRVVTVTTTTTREVVASGRAPLDSAVPVPVRQPKRLGHLARRAQAMFEERALRQVELVEGQAEAEVEVERLPLPDCRTHLRCCTLL